MKSVSLRAIALSLPVLAALFPDLAAAQDRRVVIVNDTGRVIQRFHASNTGRDSWEEDILGRDVLRPGQSVRVNIDDRTGRCMFDLKAVFDDGQSVTRMRFDVCKESQWIVR